MNSEDFRLFHSCTSGTVLVAENVVPAHAITYIYDGEFIMANSAETVLMKKDDLLYNTKNTLFRFTKKGTKEKPYRSITVRFGTQFLKDFFAHNKPDFSKPIPERNIHLKSSNLWASFFISLQPYVQQQLPIPEDLIIEKQLEALNILRNEQPGIDHYLADFGMPGKVDLEAFMNKNYIFNLPLERFATLTGRSLSTFKRDFAKTFHTTPQRWLTQKKLELARQLMEGKSLKPSQAYLEAGFENLSHFSRAYKNTFGQSPRKQLNF